MLLVNKSAAMALTGFKESNLAQKGDCMIITRSKDRSSRTLTLNSSIFQPLRSRLILAPVKVGVAANKVTLKETVSLINR